MKILAVIAVLYLICYFFYSWLDQYGFVHGKIVIMPFEGYSTKDQPALGKSVSASLARSLNEVRAIHSAEFEDRLGEKLSTSLALESLVRVPSVALFHEAFTSVSFKPIRLGPVSIPINKLVFDFLRLIWRNPKRIVLSGIIEDYQGNLRLTVSDDVGETYTSGWVSEDSVRSVLKKEAKANAGSDSSALAGIYAVVDEVAHKIAAKRWVRTGQVRWQSLKAMTDGLRAYGDFVEKNTIQDLENSIDRVREAVRLESNWEMPRLHLARMLFMQFKPEAMLEVIEIFDDIYGTSDIEKNRFFSRIGELNAILQLIWRSSEETCEYVDEYLNRFLELSKWKNDDEKKAKEHLGEQNLTFAKAQSEMLLGHLLSTSNCRAVAKQKIPKSTANSEQHLKTAIQLYEKTLSDKKMEKLCKNNLATAHTK